MLDYYYIDQDSWEEPTAIHEQCSGTNSPFQREINEWIVFADKAWFPKEAQPTLEERFREEAEKWDRETAHLSSPLQKMVHPSYQAILGMSSESQDNKRRIITLLLCDLKTKHRDWFLALSYLTQANPINPKDSGKTTKMVASWVRWGEKQGILQG